MIDIGGPIEGTCGRADMNRTPWDYVVVTASNEEQAAVYLSQIRRRLDKGLLPRETRYEVVPDFCGQRIGSAGAAFNTIRHIAQLSGGEGIFACARVLVINSGGDSVRIPQYSVCGKLFAPVPRELTDGMGAALFDEILSSVADLPAKMPAGILTVTGDILLLFNPQAFECACFGAAALTVKDNALIGVNHGVFTPNAQGTVERFLHKRPVEQQRMAGAVDSKGNVFLDTGAIWLGSEVVRDLFALISTGGVPDPEKFSVFVNGETRLSFYADFVYPMARSSTIEEYFTEPPENGYTQALRRCRARLWETLHKYPMKLIELPAGTFLHFGTTAQALQAMTMDIKQYSAFGWRSKVLSEIAVEGSFSSVSSLVDARSSIGEGTYIENSAVIRSQIGSRCVVSNIRLDSLQVPDGTAIHCLRQKDGRFVARVYGVDDDPKRGLYDGGTFLNVPLTDYMKARGLAVEDLWADEPYNLWNARLYAPRPSAQASVCHALRLCGSSPVLTAGRPLLSMKESAECADADYLFKALSAEE